MISVKIYTTIKEMAISAVKFLGENTAGTLPANLLTKLNTLLFEVPVIIPGGGGRVWMQQEGGSEGFIILE